MKTGNISVQNSTCETFKQVNEGVIKTKLDTPRCRYKKTCERLMVKNVEFSLMYTPLQTTLNAVSKYKKKTHLRMK